MWIFGLGLLIAGLLLLVVGGILFFTIILIPLAIIAGLIGVILLVVGGLAALTHRALHYEHHYPAHEQRAANHYQYSQEVKYCTRCGAPNPRESIYCANCGKKFLE